MGALLDYVLQLDHGPHPIKDSLKSPACRTFKMFGSFGMAELKVENKNIRVVCNHTNSYLSRQTLKYRDRGSLKSKKIPKMLTLAFEENSAPSLKNSVFLRYLIHCYVLISCLFTF